MIQRMLLVVLTFVLPCVSEAAHVMGWIAVDPQSGVVVSNKVINAGTNSPVLGNGTINSADMLALYADISGAFDGAADISLANGEQVTFSGVATMHGINTANEQFRWGLFYEQESPFDAKNWSGYIASNSSNASGGALRAKIAGDNTTFVQTGNAINLRTENDGGEFLDDDYQFLLTVSRYNNQVSIDASLIGSDGWSQVWRDIVVPPTHTIFEFNRVGFLSGGGMNADQIAFSEIDVSKRGINTLTLEVHTGGPDAGLVRILNEQNANLEIDYYQITSAGGALNANRWISLAAQENSANEFEGWERAAGVNASLLSEYRLLSIESIASETMRDLGKAFQVGQPQDIEFWFGDAEGTLRRGIVKYVAEGLTGDFNRDGKVDAADYVLWRKQSAGVHSQIDYALWRENFGVALELTVQTHTVPEPSMAMLLLAIVLISMRFHNRVRPV